MRIIHVVWNRMQITTVSFGSLQTKVARCTPYSGIATRLAVMFAVEIVTFIWALAKPDDD
jgi:hypothetical protein